MLGPHKSLRLALRAFILQTFARTLATAETGLYCSATSEDVSFKQQTFQSCHLAFQVLDEDFRAARYDDVHENVVDEEAYLTAKDHDFANAGQILQNRKTSRALTHSANLSLSEILERTPGETSLLPSRRLKQLQRWRANLRRPAKSWRNALAPYRERLTKLGTRLAFKGKELDGWIKEELWRNKESRALLQQLAEAKKREPADADKKPQPEGGSEKPRPSVVPSLKTAEEGSATFYAGAVGRGEQEDTREGRPARDK
ncbi:hypothetical protein MTO96_023143 [Rhipicephalus appendiculatus]